MSFIVISGGHATNIYTREFLESIIVTLDTKGGISIDPLKLIPRVCNQGAMIFSFFSDQDYFRNIRFFFDGTDENMKNDVQRELRNAVSDATNQRKSEFPADNN